METDSQTMITIFSFVLSIVAVVAAFLWKINDIRVEQSKTDSIQDTKMAVLENKITTLEGRSSDIMKTIEETKKLVYDQGKEFNSIISDLKQLITDNNMAINNISAALEHLITERKELKDLVNRKFGNV